VSIIESYKPLVPRPVKRKGVRHAVRFAGRRRDLPGLEFYPVFPVLRDDEHFSSEIE
jgi:hypothetical protein